MLFVAHCRSSGLVDSCRGLAFGVAGFVILIARIVQRGRGRVLVAVGVVVVDFDTILDGPTGRGEG